MCPTSFMSFNAFLRMLLFSLSFLLQFSLIFISPWRLYHLAVFIAKLPDENLVLVIAFLLIKLFKFRHYSFLKDFIWEGLDTEVLSSFWGKLMFIFIFFLINFIYCYISFLSISFLLSSLTIHPLWFSVTVIIIQRDHKDKILFCI